MLHDGAPNFYLVSRVWFMLPESQLFVPHYTKGVYLQPECHMTHVAGSRSVSGNCCYQHIGLKELT